jgi:hypothetical protein
VVVPAARRRTTTRVSAAGSPDRRGGHATLLEASITARLLGMRLLTLDAKVALVPAEVTVAGPQARESTARVSALPAGYSRGHHGLADAVRNLNEGERLLAEVQRRNGA